MSFVKDEWSRIETQKKNLVKNKISAVKKKYQGSKKEESQRQEEINSKDN
jgi:hypothetical protein